MKSTPTVAVAALPLPERLLSLLHQVENKNMFPADAAAPGVEIHRWYCRCCC